MNTKFFSALPEQPPLTRHPAPPPSAATARSPQRPHTPSHTPNDTWFRLHRALLPLFTSVAYDAATPPG